MITQAFSFGPVSLVVTISAVQPLIVIFIGFLIGGYIFRDKAYITRGFTLQRVLALISVIAGIFLIRHF